MLLTKRIQSFAVVVVLALGLLPVTLRAQKDGKKEPKPIPADAHAVLWQEPTDIASRDLLLGFGGEALKPDLSHVVFLKDETRSYSTKYRVRDGAGHEWVVKIGQEAQSETAATRLVWAAGYFVDPTYLVPHVVIEGKGGAWMRGGGCATACGGLRASSSRVWRGIGGFVSGGIFEGCVAD